MTRENENGVVVFFSSTRERIYYYNSGGGNCNEIGRILLLFEEFLSRRNLNLWRNYGVCLKFYKTCFIIVNSNEQYVK